MFRRACTLLASLRREREHTDREADIDGTGEVIATPEYNSWYGIDREFERIEAEAKRRER